MLKLQDFKKNPVSEVLFLMVLLFSLPGLIVLDFIPILFFRTSGFMNSFDREKTDMLKLIITYYVPIPFVISFIILLLRAI